MLSSPRSLLRFDFRTTPVLVSNDDLSYRYVGRGICRSMQIYRSSYLCFRSDEIDIPHAQMLIGMLHRTDDGWIVKRFVQGFIFRFRCLFATCLSLAQLIIYTRTVTWHRLDVSHSHFSTLSLLATMTFPNPCLFVFLLVMASRVPSLRSFSSVGVFILVITLHGSSAKTSSNPDSHPLPIS